MFKFLCIAILAVLWWAALWLVLPIGWLHGTLPSFIAVHIAPPLLPVAAWWAGKRAWAWHKTRVKERSEKMVAAEKEAAHEAAKAAHLEDMEHRHAHVECRAVWAEFAPMPDWAKDGAKQCTLLAQTPKTIQGTGRKAALISSLQRVFAAAFAQCEAAVWLPVMLLGDDPEPLEWVAIAWNQAIAQCEIQNFPPQPDCEFLSSNSEILDRLIAMFADDPGLPAVILAGMDSPLADSALMGYSNADENGHAVIAVLLSRQALMAPPDDVQTNSSEPEDENHLLPYWERKHKADTPQWERIPPPLRQVFWGLSPIAALRRSSAVSALESEWESVQNRQIRDAIHDAFIHAGLLDWPFKEEKSEKESTQAEQAKPKEPEPLKLGWFVHDSNDGARLAMLILALENCGCERISLSAETSNPQKEHGNTGMARSVLMLAEALVRAAKLQKPVLAAETDERGQMRFRLARPLEEVA